MTAPITCSASASCARGCASCWPAATSSPSAHSPSVCSRSSTRCWTRRWASCSRISRSTGARAPRCCTRTGPRGGCSRACSRTRTATSRSAPARVWRWPRSAARTARRWPGPRTPRRTSPEGASSSCVAASVHMMLDQPQGIPGSALTGPWAVGQYAAQLRKRLREFARVQVFGEVCGFKAGRAKVWFELRDAGGALPCSMWREDFEALGIAALRDGAQVVVAGGCDSYPGSRTASPSFSFAVTELRVAGEGDLLAQLEQLRRRLYGEGLFEPQKALARAALPRCIGVVTGEAGKARDDVLAGLRRRGWGGRVVWAFAPVQARPAAPAVTRALQDLAACSEVEVVIVARGGGSLADLFAFCDETLCRTVALLRVPVIASVGHHTDRTLLDDVAAVACSTPTHAAEAAVALDCTAAGAPLARAGGGPHRGAGARECKGRSGAWSPRAPRRPEPRRRCAARPAGFRWRAPR